MPLFEVALDERSTAYDAYGFPRSLGAHPGLLVRVHDHEDDRRGIRRLHHAGDRLPLSSVGSPREPGVRRAGRLRAGGGRASPPLAVSANSMRCRPPGSGPFAGRPRGWRARSTSRVAGACCLRGGPDAPHRLVSAPRAATGSHGERALAFALSVGLLEGLGALAADRIPRMDEVGVDSGVLLFLVLVTGAVALLFGVSRAGPFIPSS